MYLNHTWNILKSVSRTAVINPVLGYKKLLSRNMYFHTVLTAQFMGPEIHDMTFLKLFILAFAQLPSSWQMY